MAPPGRELARQVGDYGRFGRAVAGAAQGHGAAHPAAAAARERGRLGRVGLHPAGGPEVAAP
eukprot:10745059-Alexandrium_andersonii.AAC.1